MKKKRPLHRTTKLRDANEAVRQFEKHAQIHGAASDNNPARANKSHDLVREAAGFLGSQGEMSRLQAFLSHPSDAVRVWAAYFLLPTNAAEAVAVLEEIAKTRGIQGLDASMTLSLWRDGQLMYEVAPNRWTAIGPT